MTQEVLYPVEDETAGRCQVTSYVFLLRTLQYLMSLDPENFLVDGIVVRINRTCLFILAPNGCFFLIRTANVSYLSRISQIAVSKCKCAQNKN